MIENGRSKQRVGGGLPRSLGSRMSRVRSHIWLNVLLPLPLLFPTLGSTLVTRKNKRDRFTRWCIFSVKNSLRAASFKATLKFIVDGRKRARVTFHNVSQFRVDLVWENAVTYDSAAVLIKLATEGQPVLKSWGRPQGFWMTWVQLRLLRPQGSRVEPQMKLRLLL